MKTNRSTILHYWNNGHSSPATVARTTKIPVRTVIYDIGKIRGQGTIEDRPYSGQPRKITSNDHIALGQWIRRNNEITSKELAQKLIDNRGLDVSRWIVQREIKLLVYKSTLPYSTPMSSMKPATNCFETPYVDGREI